MDIHQFALKYGIQGMSLVVERVLELLPEDKKKSGLVTVLNEMSIDLQTSLEKVIYNK